MEFGLQTARSVVESTREGRLGSWLVGTRPYHHVGNALPADLSIGG
jgi:hypothetical protein